MPKVHTHHGATRYAMLCYNRRCYSFAILLVLSLSKEGSGEAKPPKLLVGGCGAGGGGGARATPANMWILLEGRWPSKPQLRCKSNQYDPTPTTEHAADYRTITLAGSPEALGRRQAAYLRPVASPFRRNPWEEDQAFLRACARVVTSLHAPALG